MKKKIPFYVFLLIIITWIFCVIPKNNFKKDEVFWDIGDKNISLIVADTPESQERGLSGMKSLPKDTAMYLVFDHPDKYGIWMKDMKFPIDIIWLDKDHRIVSLERNVATSTYPKVFSPIAPSLYVIETKSGFSNENNLIVGKVLNIIKN